MPKTSTTESLLALFAGRARAAAILGDLTEMAATRGRLYFWTTYARTLVALTWRIVLALFIADVGRELIFNLANLYFHLTPHTWRTTSAPYLLDHMGPFFACILSTLWFALPFAAVRYGLRDRFVQLTFAVAVGTTVAFLFIPWASLLLAAATLLLAAAALASKTWRRPLAVLAGTGAAGLLLVAISSALRLRLILSHSYTLLTSVLSARGLRAHPNGAQTLAGYANMVVFQSSLLLLALVCARLHRRLLDQPPSANSTLA